jgi:membrane fusion protein (multidrug efflux system)
MIAIVVTDERGLQRELQFDAPRIRIGRGEDNDVVLDSHACSRHHAEIVREGAVYKIVDLGSTNGIKVGDTKVPDLFLVDGTSVVLGVHRLDFSIEQPAADKTILLAPGAMPAPVSVPPEPRAEPAALYLVYRQQGEGRSLKIVAGARYVIGRSPDADLVVNDSHASKRHALVYSEGDGFCLRDLGSSNGTLLNGRRAGKEPLVAGDEIVIGNQVIAVQDQRLDLEDDAVLLGKTRLGVPPGFDPGSLKQRVAPSDEEKSPRRLGPVLFAGAAILLALGAFFVLRQRPDEATGVERQATSERAVAGGAEALIVRVAPVETKQLARSVDGSGTIRPHRTVKVSAEIPGQVVSIAVDEGFAVAAGDLLARINDTDIRLRLEEARAAASKERVDLARQEYERMQSLLEEKVVSRAMVDQAQSQYLTLDAAYKSARAKIRQLQEQLRKADITAPISGRVAKRLVNQGEYLAPGAPVVVIENMEDVLVVLEVPDRDIVKVQLGQTVEATTDAFPGRVFRGVVDSSATAANPVTSTFEVEARIGNRDGSLRSGMIASLRILLEQSRAMVIPAEALIGSEEAQTAVFVVADGLARRRSVVLGERWDRDVEVLSGLASGDEVVVSGMERLADGQRVQVYRGL